jgi:hypothetical protein
MDQAVRSFVPYLFQDFPRSQAVDGAEPKATVLSECHLALGALQPHGPEALSTRRCVAAMRSLCLSLRSVTGMARFGTNTRHRHRLRLFVPMPSGIKGGFAVRWQAMHLPICSDDAEDQLGCAIMVNICNPASSPFCFYSTGYGSSLTSFVTVRTSILSSLVTCNCYRILILSLTLVDVFIMFTLHSSATTRP